MKRLVLALIITVGYSYAGPSSPVCASVAGTQGLSIGADTSGCLGVNSTYGLDGASQNSASDGLFVNPYYGESGVNNSAAEGGFQQGQLQVNYTVTYEGTYYQYQYTFAQNASGEDISHIVLGLGNTCTTATTADVKNSCIYDLSTSGTSSSTVDGLSHCFTAPCTIPVTADTTGGSFSNGFISSASIVTLAGGNSDADPGIPNFGTSAIQIVPATKGLNLTVTFDSVYAPVWEDVYIRDDSSEAYQGTSVEAWNNTTDDFYIPSIGDTVVPEPRFYILLGLSLSGLSLFRRSRRKRSSAAR